MYAGAGPRWLTLSRMREPDLTGQKAGRDADKGSGDYIADKMPVAEDQQHRCEQQHGKEGQDGDPMDSHENTGESTGKNHVARGKAAVR